MAAGSSLSKLLRTHRDVRGLTQEELAERAGVSARAVSDIERGLRTKIYRDTAERIAGALALEGPALALFRSAARGERDVTATDGGRPSGGLIGRDDEVAALLTLLRDEDVRLITLTGPAGTGKTRLAIEVLDLVRHEFGDGAAFVSLAGTSSAEIVSAVLQHALGIASSEQPLDALTSALRDKELLVLLDTFEHLLDAGPVLSHLVECAPRLKILVTSRSPLRLRSEHEFRVPPLGLPAANEDESAATRMFDERMKRASPAAHAERRVVAEICRRLDGLPLAIELAAARARHLPLPALLDLLERQLDVLVDGYRDLPDRQQTMRGAIAWSFDLLEDREREIFARLSVFPGEMSFDAARAVVGVNDVVDSLTGLVDQNLLVLDGDGRYRMLDAIREFAAEQLGPDEATGSAHAAYFTVVAEAAEAELGGARQDEWFERLDLEQDNMRGALAFAIARADADTAARLTGALWQYWRERGNLAEARDWMKQALALEPSTEPRAKVLWGAAWLAYHQGEYDEADRLSVELLALARRHTDPVVTRNALTVRGMVAMADGRSTEALRSFEEAVRLARALGPGWLLATSLLNLGGCLAHMGKAAAADEPLAEALALYRDLGDRRFAARAVTYAAQVAVERGDLAEAERLVMEALSESRAVGDDSTTVEALETLAVIQASTDPEAATRTVAEAAVLRERTRAHPFPFHRRWMDKHLQPILGGPDQH